MTAISVCYASPEIIPEQVIKREERARSIPVGLLLAVCTVESNLRPLAVNRDDGKTGQHSYGLCQLKLATASLMGYTGEADGLLRADTNARLAAKYLRRQYNRYGSWELAVAAYNRGSPRMLPNGRLSNDKYIKKVYKIWLR